jgi:hypothetical protein
VVVDAYTKAEADTKFVDVTGDAMTGDLTISKAMPAYIIDWTGTEGATAGSVTYKRNGIDRFSLSIVGTTADPSLSVIRYNSSGVYVDSHLAFASDGYVTIYKDPVSAMHAATKQYVDNNSGGVYISDSPPAHSQGKLWWSSLNACLYISYNDGTSSQWVQINTVGS